MNNKKTPASKRTNSTHLRAYLAPEYQKENRRVSASSEPMHQLFVHMKSQSQKTFAHKKFILLHHQYSNISYSKKIQKRCK